MEDEEAVMYAAILAGIAAMMAAVMFGSAGLAVTAGLGGTLVFFFAAHLGKLDARNKREES